MKFNIWMEKRWHDTTGKYQYVLKETKVMPDTKQEEILSSWIFDEEAALRTMEHHGIKEKDVKEIA